MARVPYVQDDELTEPTKSRVMGHPINLYRALANSPEGLECFAEVGQWIRYRSNLDPRQREMVILTVGVIADSDYEFSHHIKIGRDFGLTDDDIRGVMTEARGGASELGTEDRLLLRATAEMINDGAIAAPTWGELAAIFDRSLLVEFVLVVGHYACVTRVLKSLQVDVEPAYQGYLEEFPLNS